MLATYLPIGIIIRNAFFIGARQKNIPFNNNWWRSYTHNDITCTCKVICKIYRYEWWWANVKLNVILIYTIHSMKTTNYPIRRRHKNDIF